MEETTTPPATDAAATQAAAASASKAEIPKDMHIKVYSPFHTYFDDRATSISGVNDTGPFDILPGHRNFMTLVSACELVIRSDKGENKIKIARAVMHVKANDIVVFLDV
jgi:F0F1-type ATP synthase epsilon subunit